MIYTGYYSALYKYLIKVPTLTFVSISGKPPKGWHQYHYKQLAPSYSIWKEWTDNQSLPLEEKIELYTTRFNNEILEKLDPFVVVNDLYELTNSFDIMLLCYEKFNNFCHRHLVSKWLTQRTFQPVNEIIL